MSTTTSNRGAEEAFFHAMWEWLRSSHTFPELPGYADPVSVLKRLKAERPAEAARGLREAVRDLIEMTSDLSGQELNVIDRYLRDRGAPTLTAFRLQQKRFLKRLIKRGRISRVEEYRFLVSLLSEVGETGPENEVRSAVSRLVLDYDARVGPKDE